MSELGQAGEMRDDPPKTVSHVLGEITWLLSRSPIHKNLFISDLEWLVMPAILLEQFRLFHGSDGQPVGLVLWGMISDEAAARFEAQQGRIAPQEWRSGENAWLIEMVAPFGGQEEMLVDVGRTIFHGLPFKYHASGPTGIEVRVHCDPTP